MTSQHNLNRLDDATLLEQARTGEHAAVEELLRRYRPQVEGFLKRRARHAEDAADLSQEVLIGATTGLPTYRGGGDFRAWINGIAKNVLKNYYGRVLKRSELVTSLDSLGESTAQRLESRAEVPSPADAVLHDYSLIHLLAAMSDARCSAAEQNVIRLYYQAESCEEIGALLEMPSATVRSHLLRGRRKLLIHLVENQPELFGGKEGIEAAWQRACSASSSDERPTERERVAWERRRWGTAEYGGAILKLARHLTLLPTVLWLLLRAKP